MTAFKNITKIIQLKSAEMVNLVVKSEADIANCFISVFYFTAFFRY